MKKSRYRGAKRPNCMPMRVRSDRERPVCVVDDQGRVDANMYLAWDRIPRLVR